MHISGTTALALTEAFDELDESVSDDQPLFYRDAAGNFIPLQSADMRPLQLGHVRDIYNAFAGWL